MLVYGFDAFYGVRGAANGIMAMNISGSLVLRLSKFSQDKITHDFELVV